MTLYYDMLGALKLYFPFLQDEIISYKIIGGYEMIVKLQDGTSILYDDFDKSIRRLPKDSQHMSKEEQVSEFGLRLSRIMYHKGLTQKDLSEMTGISQPLLSNYITGKKSPSFYAVDKIAKALDCSTDDFRYVDE